MSLTATVTARRTSATIKVRQNISQMSPGEIDRFRAALTTMLGRRDDRGFQFFAGWHGVPFGICQHHVPLFLPWHRGYLYHFELALQDIDPAVTLPWWDWLTEPGVPAAYGDETVGGKPNVLFSMPIEPFGVAPDPDWPTQTSRDPGSSEPGQPAPIPPPLNGFEPEPDTNCEAWVTTAPSYTELTRRLEALHDNVHGWCGGTMRDISWAAYDPLFWAHHAMVDRLWRIWQHTHPGAGPPDALIDACMTFAKPPGMSPRSLSKVQDLGYEYAGFVSVAGGTD